MKKSYSLLLFLMASVSLVYSQQLVVVPNDSAEITANVTDEFEPNDIHIEVVNNTANTITATWGLVNYTAPSGWEVKLCDNNNCYDLILGPGPYESLPVAAGDTLDMKFQYTAHLISGTGNTNVFLYKTGDSSNTVVFLNYKANLTAVSGIKDNETTSNLKLYPNPVQRTFVVSGLKDAGNLSFEVYDVKGAVMKTKIVNASASQIEISVENLSKGDYILKAFDSSGKAVGTSKLNKTN